MTPVFWFAVVVLWAATYAVLWRPDSKRWHRFVVLALGALALGVALAAESLVQGTPRPAYLEWRAPARVQVLGYHLIQNEAIYVLVLWPDSNEPIYYRMPWDQDTANQLVEAEQEAEEGRTTVESALFEPSIDPQDPLFYALPQEKPPVKQEPAPARRIERR